MLLQEMQAGFCKEGLQRGFPHMNSGQEGQDPYAEKFLKD